jgi:hypothetical protein
MQPIRLDEIMGRDRYGVVRAEVRRRLVEHKRARRVALGDRVSLVFEDRATVWYQVQEMLWVEHVTDLDAVRAELAVYNTMLPGPAELSATLLIEITDKERVADELQRLIGIDEHVHLDIGGDRRVAARFESGRQTAEKLSAVQYVRFPLDDEAVRRVRAGAALAIRVDHPHYRQHVALPDPVRASIAGDFDAPQAGEQALRWVRDGA